MKYSTVIGGRLGLVVQVGAQSCADSIMARHWGQRLTTEGCESPWAWCYHYAEGSYSIKNHLELTGYEV